MVLLGWSPTHRRPAGADITSFVIVTEMTQNHALMIPLMVAALVADAASKAVCRSGLYHTLAEIMLERADVPGSPSPDGMRIKALPGGRGKEQSRLAAG